MSVQIVRQTLQVLGSAVLLGVVSGLVWWQLAEPSLWEVRDFGIVMTEEGSRGQFGVIAMFVLVGAIASLVWGFAVCLIGRRSGWELVVAVLLGSTLAAVIAWQVGIWAGPPSPGSVPGLSVGDTVPDQLGVDALAPFIVWPIAAMTGMLPASIAMRGHDDQPHDGQVHDAWGYERETDATTAPVNDTRW